MAINRNSPGRISGAAIKNLFKNPLFKRKLWILPVKPEKKIGRLNLSRETYLDKRYPGLRDREY